MTESPFYTGDKYHSSDPNPTPKSKPLQGIIAWLIGAVIGRYVGINFIIPAVFIGLAYLIYRKLVFKNKPLFFLEASVLLCGHASWGFAGMIFMEMNDQGLEQLATILNILEFSIYLGFSFFLLKSPNYALPVVLIIIEVLLIIMNAVTIADQPFGTDNHRALTAHLALRAGIVLGALSGLKKLNSARQIQTQQPEPAQAGTGQSDS